MTKLFDCPPRNASNDIPCCIFCEIPTTRYQTQRDEQKSGHIEHCMECMGTCSDVLPWTEIMCKESAVSILYEMLTKNRESFYG